MKDAMLSLDIYAWLAENREKIVGGFIKKIYQIGEREFLFKIYKGGNLPLYVNLDGFLFFREMETPEKPSMFAMYLRKRFSNRKIVEIKQINFDRVVSIKTEDYELIIELFGGGNIVVVKEGIIERAYYEREWRHRSILRGEIYEPPPSKYNPLLHSDRVCEAIKEGKKSVVRVLAIDFNLGKYAEEVCYRAQVDKNKKELNEEECKRISQAIAEILKPGGCYLYGDFFSPIKLLHREKEEESCESFNRCIEKYVSRIFSEGSGDIKYLRIIEDQRRKMREFEEMEKKMRKIGDLIYSHYVELEELLQKAKNNEVEYDRKRKKIKVSLEGEEFELDIEKSVGENASVYYEKAKKMREKIAGVKKAIVEMQEKIRREEKKAGKNKKKRARFWFEKYRWFISSEDILVIAGRDAKTNEEVVKKHLSDRDLYMHADIHGAPSVVIKSEGRKIGEKTLYEAAQFAVSMSNAWNAGFGNLSAYWVYPSQVSKMGESGEYVTRGAWVVHGRRNYINKVPLKLAVGEIKYKNVKMVMCGPVDAVKSKTNRYIVIAPGDLKKEAFAKKIAKIFGEDVDSLLKILPPGKIGIEEIRGIKIQE